MHTSDSESQLPPQWVYIPGCEYHIQSQHAEMVAAAASAPESGHTSSWRTRLRAPPPQPDTEVAAGPGQPHRPAGHIDGHSDLAAAERMTLNLAGLRCTVDLPARRGTTASMKGQASRGCGPMIG